MIRNLSVAFVYNRATHAHKFQLKIWPSIAIHQQVSCDFLDIIAVFGNLNSSGVIFSNLYTRNFRFLLRVEASRFASSSSKFSHLRNQLQSPRCLDSISTSSSSKSATSISPAPASLSMHSRQVPLGHTIFSPSTSATSSSHRTSMS